MAQALFSPLQEFSADPTKYGGSDPDKASANALMKKELDKSAEPGLCTEFLAIQAEMLMGRPDFRGVQIVPALTDPTSAGAYDPITQDITVASAKKSSKLANTFAHEMTHGIEFHCDCKTEGKVLAMLRSRGVTDLAGPGDYGSELMKNLQKTLTPDIAGQFKNQVQEYQGQEAEILSRELGSYCFESIYNEAVLGTGKPGIGTFQTRFAEIQDKGGSRGDSPSKEFARDLVAVSMYQINDQMIRYINRPHAPPLTPERTEILGRLQSIQAELTPHYSAAIARAEYQTQLNAVPAPDPAKRYRKEVSTIEVHTQSPADSIRNTLIARGGTDVYSSPTKPKTNEIKK